ncbi:MAG TPA: TIGR02281 family clan AA aspartic protease [Pseudorhizobium sp.]|nr:TIGR02281 family clan AA aspartic protease [Pseudorhizobium sp.]
MLARSLIVVALAALVASQVPALLGLTDASLSTTAPPERVQPEASATGAATIRADALGHFNAIFRFNGKPVEGVIDTGASFVALNETTARRLGLAGSRLKFTHSVNTANGKTEAAHVVLDRIELDGLQVLRVDAFVLRDNALSSTLVGMSFLNKLSFTVDRGTLKLTK